MSTILSLFAKLTEAHTNKLPFVAFRKPNSINVEAFFQKDTLLHKVETFKEEGFVFAPFDANKTAYVLQVDTAISATYDFTIITDHSSTNESLAAEKAHIELVKDTISFLKENDISKIVVARPKEVSLNSNFIAVFQQLLTKYPTAYVYVWYHPKIGLWLGATPETLVEIKQGNFKTMSLAGTQKFEGSVDVQWGEKELEEQQMVTDYVLSNLKEVTNSLAHSTVKTVKAGSLLHLKTDITGELKKEFSLEKLIKTLHPTPAVCGFPKELAKDFILKNEGFDRSYYTGYLGAFNRNNCSSLFVNLRCMEVVNTQTVRLYVGGGITAKSDPRNEWLETVAKTRTIESSL
ncbi:isochorismate synthase [Flavicella sediminum]|uniref:isochorismate synthase n=1 Tax=Flavicella sediminum TaxID=2585141 RepID=UPI001FB5FB1F|nr:isochorismate synthase [Flavicella sediminum]